MTKITYEMVEAALRSWLGMVLPHERITLSEKMRAALEAAVAVGKKEEALKADVKWVAIYPPCPFPDNCGRRGQHDCTNMACPVPLQGRQKQSHALAVTPKDEASERKSAFEAAEASAWPELEWAGERGSRLIVYDGVNVLAPVRDIRQAIASLSKGDRQHTVMLARRAIEKALPAVRQGTASHYVAMRCARDIAIWFANEVIEGRETLEMNEP